jgi:hypothetical protein
MRAARLGAGTVSALGALAAAASLAACGGSSHDGVSAASYARSLCAAVAPFEDEILRRSKALRLAPNKTVAENRDALHAFLVALGAATARALGRLRAAGTPDVPRGSATAAAFVGSFARIERAFSAAARRAASLPTGNVDAYRTAASALVDSVKASIGQLGQSLGALRSPEIQAAARKLPACHALG